MRPSRCSLGVPLAAFALAVLAILSFSTPAVLGRSLIPRRLNRLSGSSQVRLTLDSLQRQSGGDQFPDYFMTDEGSIHNCGQDSDVFHLQSVVLNPDPPKRGASLSIVLKGTLDENVEKGAWAQVRVKLGLIKFVDTKIDICDELGKIDHACPVEKGPFELEHSVDVPGELPPGRYTIDVDATNHDGSHLACVSAVFRL